MKKISWKGKKLQNILAITFCLVLVAICTIIIRISATENAPGTWADEYQAKVAPRFADSSMMSIVEASEFSSLSSKNYNGNFDVDHDGNVDAIQIYLSNRENVMIATIHVDGYDDITYEAEALGGDSKALGIMGVTNDDGRTGIAVVESIYDNVNGFGYLKCHVWNYQDGTIHKVASIGYNSLIGSNGFVDVGMITSDIPEDSFSWSRTEHQNNFIYERSRMMADMREWGILFPYATVDKFVTNYKYKVAGLCHVIIK